LGVSRSIVRSALIDYGIATQQPSPFVYNREESTLSGVSVEPNLESRDSEEVIEDDNILNPSFTLPQTFPSDI
jgi:hypothetical protein